MTDHDHDHDDDDYDRHGDDDGPVLGYMFYTEHDGTLDVYGDPDGYHDDPDGDDDGPF